MGQNCISRQHATAVIKDEGTHSPSLAASSLQILRPLGCGSFACVKLARLASNQYAAVKVMNKAHILRQRQLEHVYSERRILRLMDSPFIVQFLGTLQDAKNLYCVMEFVQGGDLFSVLCKKERLDSKSASFYMAEVVLALAHLHSIFCAYRDLKPENIMITARGHVKLVDFGFAKIIPRGEKTHTTCGTPEYMAPEVIEQAGHDCSVDWWQAGILLYEMLAGFSPFFARSPYSIYEMIVTYEVAFPAGFDPDAKDLVAKLLRKDPQQRPGERDIRKHPFFKHVDWSAVKTLKAEPPFVPTLLAADDTNCFEEVKEKDCGDVLEYAELQKVFEDY